MHDGDNLQIFATVTQLEVEILMKKRRSRYVYSRSASFCSKDSLRYIFSDNEGKTVRKAKLSKFAKNTIFYKCFNNQNQRFMVATKLYKLFYYSGILMMQYS